MWARAVGVRRESAAGAPRRAAETAGETCRPCARQHAARYVGSTPRRPPPTLAPRWQGRTCGNAGAVCALGASLACGLQRPSPVWRVRADSHGVCACLCAAQRAPDLECEEQHKDFDGIVAAVGDVAIEEEAVLGGGQAVELEDPQHVLQLPVRVAAYEEVLRHRGRGGHVLQRAVLVRLLFEHRERVDQDRVDALARDARLARRETLLPRLAQVAVEHLRLIERPRPLELAARRGGGARAREAQ
eukprot:1104856-Prymnesium_polylepis.1